MLSLGKLSVVASLLLIGFTGCNGGPAKAKTYAVTGKVTAGGAPLANSVISFVPASGGEEGGSATIGADGTYTLNSLDGRSGCAAGKYKVVLKPGAQAMQDAMKNMKGPGMPQGDSKIPKEYSDASTSPKEVEVKAEANVIDIAI